MCKLLLSVDQLYHGQQLLTGLATPSCTIRTKVIKSAFYYWGVARPPVELLWVYATGLIYCEPSISWLCQGLIDLVLRQTRKPKIPVFPILHIQLTAVGFVSRNMQHLVFGHQSEWAFQHTARKMRRYPGYVWNPVRHIGDAFPASENRRDPFHIDIVSKFFIAIFSGTIILWISILYFI